MKNNDINEDEIRVIGKKTPRPKQGKYPWLWPLVTACALIVAVLLLVFLPNRMDNDSKQKNIADTTESFFEGSSNVDDEWYSNDDPNGLSYIHSFDTVVDGTPLRIITPYNTNPELTVGPIDTADHSILLCTQAADLRKDNGKILGAFVLRGQPLAWGLSKRGYCAIVDGQVTVGVSDNSPLFELATEQEGYFFRQYPLVDNGEALHNNPENVSHRRALCAWQDRICIVISLEPLLMDQFSNALASLGVRDAIYLVGSNTAQGWTTLADGSRCYFAKTRLKVPQNINYIIFRSKNK